MAMNSTQANPVHSNQIIQQIPDVVARLRENFNSGVTLDYQVRVDNLKKLKLAIVRYEARLHSALKQDLAKPEFEAYLSETGFCLHELSGTLAKLKRWMRPKWVLSTLLVQPGSSRIMYSPRGVNLIIAPYNYPVMLALSPLIVAIAAGNTAVVKTSEMTPACSEVIGQLIDETFDANYVAYVPGAVAETTALLEQKFDHIFFTGSARVGTIVMVAAARNLTPVTLELGGKSPCIVDKDAHLDIAAKRIVATKFLNAGQTCVAPDYLIVHRQIKEQFLECLKNRILRSYGEDPTLSPDYARIINDSHFSRILSLIDKSKIVIGGGSDSESRYIAPTVLRDVTIHDAVMSEEIFGPVLPVVDYDNLDDIFGIISNTPHYPLACYIFSNDKQVQDTLLTKLQFGGACINNCVLHIVNPYLPFGGVGQSGMGAYHGFHGFECFSHKKGVLWSHNWLDVPLVYAPCGNKIKLLRKLMH